MASNYRRRKRESQLVKKLKRYKKKDERTLSFRKYRVSVALMCLAIGWLWSLAHERGAAFMGSTMMIIAAIYIYKDLRYIFSPDPVDEIINDLEQQFWDLDFRKDTDSM